MERLILPLEIKTSSAEGTFEGFLSTYNTVDEGNDAVMKGAFSKTIRDNKGQVPLLWQHQADNPIGKLQLEDRPEGLRVQGKILTGLRRGAEALLLIRHGIVRGLSIGYQTIKAQVDDKGVRRILEARLFEGSVVTFPMNPEAVITALKAAQLKVETSREADELSDLLIRIRTILRG